MISKNWADKTGDDQQTWASVQKDQAKAQEQTFPEIRNQKSSSALRACPLSTGNYNEKIT